MRGGKWTFRGIHLYKCTKRWKRKEIQNWNVSFQQRVQRVHVVHKKNDHSHILNSVFIRQSNFVGFHSSCFSFVWFWFCFIELQLYMHGFLYPEVKQSVNIDGVCLLLCSLLMTNGFWDDRNKFVHTLVAQFFRAQFQLEDKTDLSTQAYKRIEFFIQNTQSIAKCVRMHLLHSGKSNPIFIHFWAFICLSFCLL